VMHHHEKLYLQLDRTFFTPGETVWFNAYLRNAFDLLPATGSQVLHVQLLDARGAVMQEKNILAFDGTAAGDFVLYNTLPGGVYKIKAWTNWMRNTDEVFEREITLQKTVLPNLNLRLEFERKGLGPGDEAVARFDALALNNQPIAGRDIRFSVSLGGKEYQTGAVKTDATGRAWVRFRLPESLDTPDGLLNIQLDNDGRPEAISRPVPIVLNRIDLRFFPEGGDMVAGMPSRLGFKAVNEFGKPADVSGRILDSKGRQVARFESFHDGMGACELVPQAGERYTARLNQPVGNVQVFTLPQCQPDGYTLRLLDRNTQNLRFEVAGSRPAKVYLAGAVRDRIFFFRECQLGDQAQTLEIPVQALPPGIATFTLFDEKQQAQAERLVFVNRDRGLQIDIQPDKPQYLPREKVRLNLRVRDGNGAPVQGQFSLSVVDEKLLSFADDKQGHILSSLLLEQDVNGKIEDPNFYFDPREPKADQALDYLLMTQGWRRFCWKQEQTLPPTYRYPAETAVLSGQFLKSDNEPWANRKVTLYPGGPEALTDKTGRFEFKNIDISQYAYLLFPNNRYVPVYNYQQNLVVYADGQTSSYQSWAVPDATGKTTLCGRLTDELGEDLIGVSVAILHRDRVQQGLVTDINGYFEAQINPGEYDIRFSYTGYSTSYVKRFTVKEGTKTSLNATLAGGRALSEVAVLSATPAVPQNRPAGGALTSEEIKNLPTRNLNAVVATAPEIDGGDVNIRSARDNAVVYYIDGIRVEPDKAKQVAER
ncbi:MAG TPA: carboxypeptidase regulatory-like domain-containing protein, partial [Saprospiraceae bacterium]|nr:carboxypeptidase regulatory-like domain-containing protein [Saprospiraceae bacterium]